MWTTQNDLEQACANIQQKRLTLTTNKLDATLGNLLKAVHFLIVVHSRRLLSRCRRSNPKELQQSTRKVVEWPAPQTEIRRQVSKTKPAMQVRDAVFNLAAEVPSREQRTNSPPATLEIKSKMNLNRPVKSRIEPAAEICAITTVRAGNGRGKQQRAQKGPTGYFPTKVDVSETRRGIYIRETSKAIGIQIRGTSTSRSRGGKQYFNCFGPRCPNWYVDDNFKWPCPKGWSIEIQSLDPGQMFGCWVSVPCCQIRVTARNYCTETGGHFAC